MAKIIKADPVYRRRFFILAVIGIAAVAVVEYYDLTNLGPHLEGIEAHEMAGRLQLLLLLVLSPLVFIGLYTIWYGRRLIRTREFPPPGSKVLVDTEVQIGMPAVIRGWVSIGVGLAMIGLVWFGVVLVPAEIEKAVAAKEESRAAGSGSARPPAEGLQR
jgi:hypothetical protein